MITITTIPNPFNELENIVEVKEFETGAVVADYLPPLDERSGIIYVIARNGEVVEDSQNIPVEDGDKIAISAKIEGEVAAGIAAWVSAAVYAGAAAAGISASVALAAMYVTYGIAYIGVMMAISYGMGQLRSALGPEPPEMGGGGAGGATRESPTYGWGALQQVDTEGNPLQILFGEQKVAGQVINQFKTVGDDNKEYIHLLLAVAGHEVDSISDIRLNGQPYTNYKGVRAYKRLGTLSDDPIPGFAQIVQLQNIGVALNSGGADHTAQTDGNSVEEINIVFVAQSGLYYSNDDGGLDERKVEFQIEYRAVGDASWIVLDNIVLRGATTEAVRKSTSITGLSPDQYEVQVTRLTGGSSDFREQTDVYWTQMSEIINEELIYPEIAKYAITALATDQLSGRVPTVTCIAARNTVSVYDSGLGSWVSKDATNPAWASYAFLNTHHGIDHSRLIYSEFEDWATWCDEVVQDEARMKISIYLDNISNAWADVQKIARIGRGAIIRRGSKYGVFVDKEETTVSHLFTVGNIISDTYSMGYLPQKDRANAVEITYNDPERDYTNQVVGVYSDDYKNTSKESIKSQVKYNAAIRRSQAIREAALLLNSNKYLIRTPGFEASVDSFACVVGDLVYFQHLVPRYKESWGGRIVDAGNDDGSGNPYVQLDQEVDLVAGTTYAVLVRLSDDSLIEKTVQIVGSDITTDTLKLQSSWSIVPQQYDLYNAGPASTYKKKYRVISITRAQELTRHITLMEYVDAIYNDTGYVIDTPTWGDEVTQEAVQVSVREFLSYGKGGDYQSNLAVSWNPATTNVGSNWAVWLESEFLTRQFIDDLGGEFEDDTFTTTEEGIGVVKVGETTENRFRIGPQYLVQGQEYKIYVGPIDEGMKNTGDNTTHIQILGKLAPPNNVTGFTGIWNAMKRTVNFAWNAIGNLDASHYEIRQGSTWDAGTVVVKEAKSENVSIPIEEGVSETRTYLIKAVDTSGIYSVNYDSVDVVINTADCPLQTPTGLSLSTQSGIASDGTDRVTILAEWDANAEVTDEFRHYELLFEVISSGRKSTYVTAETEYQLEVMPNIEYGVSVRAIDMTGNKTAWATQQTIIAAKDSSAPAAPSWAATPLVPGFKVIGLRWQKNTEYDLSHYEVQRSDTGDFAGEEVDLGNKDGNFTTDTDLSVSTTYYYRVRAVDTSGNASGWSTIQNITTLQVGETDIAYDAIIANHINVTQLSAISADVGTLTAGVIQSTNWSPTAGAQIDLDNELIQFGGSDAPKLKWDGTNLILDGGGLIAGTVNADVIVAGTVTADKFESTFYGNLNQAINVTQQILSAGSTYEQAITQAIIDNATINNIDADDHPADYDISLRLLTQRIWDESGEIWDEGNWDIPVESSGTFETASQDIESEQTIQLSFDYFLAQESNTSITVEAIYSLDNINWGSNDPGLDDGNWETPNVTEVSFNSYHASGNIYTLRYYKIRVTLSTTDINKNIIVYNMVVRGVIVYSYGAEFTATIASGGTTFSISGFNAEPAVLVTPKDSSPLVPVVTAADSTGFTVKLFNLSGTDVGGTANIFYIGV